MPKAVIINTTHFANKGSMGRIEGMIFCLERTIPQVQITILHRYYLKDKDTLVRQLIEQHPNIEVKEHPWFRENSSNILTLMSSLIRLCFSVARYNIFSKFGLSLNDEVQRFDFIVDLNLIEPNEGIYFTMTLGDFLALFDTWYSTMFEKPMIVCSATIGPYQGRFLRYLATYILNKVDLITLREGYSRNYLRTLGINKPSIYLSADLAFLLKPADADKISIILEGINVFMDNKPIVGIAPTAMMHPCLKQERYVQLMAELSDYVIKDFNATIIYITHTYQDKPIIENILQIVKNKHKVRILPNLSASEIKGVIGMCEIFVCSRFHALVASTSLAIPSLGIVAYSWGKFHGIIGEMMGQEKYLLDIDDNFEYDAFSIKLKSKVNDLWINKNLIAENLKNRAKIAEEQALLNGKLIKEIIDSMPKQTG